MTILDLLKIWKDTPNNKPLKITFRGMQFVWNEKEQDYLCDTADNYGYFAGLWDFIDDVSVLDEEVKVETDKTTPTEPTWICLDPECPYYMKETETDYYEDHDGRPVFHTKCCGSLSYGTLEEIAEKAAKKEKTQVNPLELLANIFKRPKRSERFKKTQGKIKITDEMDKIIDEPSVTVVE